MSNITATNNKTVGKGLHLTQAVRHSLAIRENE